MFALVADVDKYPAVRSAVRRHESEKPHRKGRRLTVMVAEMTVAYKIIRETFTSRATLDSPNLKILVEYLNGPFKRMQNRWTFHQTGENSCDVEFFIDYEFRSRTLAMLMGAMFDAAFRRFASAFEQRADEVYGRSHGLIRYRLIVRAA